MKVIQLLGTLSFLATFSTAVEIDCLYRTKNWNGFGYYYTCYATVISVKNPTTVTNIIGYHHLKGRNNTDVKGFEVKNQEILARIPNGVENFFANLQAFQWSSGNICSIDSNTFEPFPNLLYINLNYNKLVTIDGDLFQYTRKVSTIEFRNNFLEHAGLDLFSGLPYLRKVYFFNNSCIDTGANTTQLIQELKMQLPIKCPPLATTPDPPTTTISTTPEPNECLIRCTTNKESDEMNERIEKLEKVVAELSLNQC